MDRRFNFPEERIALGGKAFPTLLEVPDWSRIQPPMSLTVFGFTFRPPPRPGYISNLKVALIGDYNERGLLPAPSAPDAPVTVDYSPFKAHAEAIAPITEPDIVEWMHWATACEIIAEQMEQEYKRAGSYVVATSGDPYIPGVSLEDLKFRSEEGTVVSSRGTGVVVTPRGNFNCPVPGKATGIFSDLISWAGILDAWMKQWTGLLMKWLELATNPQDRIRFGNFNGLVAPQFIGHEAENPAPINFVHMVVSTDKAQTMKARYRESSDYTQEICGVDISLNQGQNDVTYQLFALPYVPTMCVEIAPEDNSSTILDSYSTSVLPI